MERKVPIESRTTSAMTCVRLWVQQTRKECLTLLPLKPLLSEPRTLKCQVSLHPDGRQEGCLGCASQEPRLRVAAATLAGPAGTPSASLGGAGGPHGSTTATPASRLTVKPVCSGMLSFHPNLSAGTQTVKGRVRESQSGTWV